MTVSASDAEATLRFVVPGFVALKVFYVFGLKTRRTDLEWMLWSLLGAAVVDAAVGLLNPPDANVRLFVALTLALLSGGIGVAVWRAVVKRWPARRMGASRRAWDAILPVPQWIQVWTKSETLILGHARVVASSVECDQLDLYLEEPQWVSAPTGERLPMPGVTGLLICESEVKMIQVLGNGERTDAET